MVKYAAFSGDRVYRYALWREWGNSDTQNGELAVFIGLNPSTADETVDDPTIRRCIGYARDWGYSGLCMLNLFAYRATDPKVMKRAVDPVGADNNRWIAEITSQSKLVVAAWGAHGVYGCRDVIVKGMVKGLTYLRLTKDGHPSHPLYLPKDLKPVAWK